VLRFILLQCHQTDCGAQPMVLLMGTGVSSTVVSGRVVKVIFHLTVGESRNERSFTSSHTRVFGVGTGKSSPLTVRSESETYLRLLELWKIHATPELRCLGVRPLCLPKLVNYYRFS